MAETITPGKELRVGDGWRYQCKRCNYQVEIGRPFPATCPGCHTRGWWGHLTPLDIAQNMDGVKKDGIPPKNPVEKMLGGITAHKSILSHAEPQNQGGCGDSKGRGRGRPRLAVPEDLIIELAGLRFSSRKMPSELDKRGFKGIGYKTVQRVLSGKRNGNGDGDCNHRLPIPL